MEERNDRRKTGLLLSILGVISLVLITAGVTYAFFSYAKEGQTENVITTGTIQFAYNESDTQGNGILLQDALPISDAAGMALDGTAGSKESFHFVVTSITPSTAKIPYVVTVKKSSDSNISDEQVKLYLVATGSETGNGNTLDGATVRTFSQLPKVTQNTITNDLYATVGDNERILFTGEVPASSSNYSTSFVLRMWLSGDTQNTAADYSPYEFVLKSSVANNDPIDAEAAITAGTFITSTDFYDLGDADRALYERVAYVNKNAKTILTYSQAINLNYASYDADTNFVYSPTTGTVAGFDQTEQYYQINGQSYTVKVNVYAEGAKVTH